MEKSLTYANEISGQKANNKPAVAAGDWERYWKKDRKSVFAKMLDRFAEITLSRVAYPHVVSIIKKNVSSGKCLEAGCGEANLSNLLLATGKYKAVLTDISAEAILKASQKINNENYQANILLSDIYNLPFKDMSFELAMNFGILEHLDDVVKAIEEMRRVSKVVIATIPCEGFLWRSVIFLRKCFEKDASIWTKGTKLYTNDRIRKHFLAANCSKVEIYSTNFAGFPFLITVVAL